MEIKCTVLEAAIQAVRETGMSTREAAKEFRISHATLSRRLKSPISKPSGGQQKFSQEEDQTFADLLLFCADFGVPMSKESLRNVIFTVGQNKGETSIYRLID